MTDRAVGNTELFVGLMSGTSLDGVDAVLADLADQRARVLAHTHRSFPAALRSEILELTEPGANEIDRGGAVTLRLVDLYAQCVRDLLDSSDRSAGDIRAIGAHGQTVRHRPAAGYTVQLNAPAYLSELTGIDVVADFRSRDIAAGGQGAPLVPAFHAALFGSDEPRAVVNIGGISNLTFLRDREAILGFDCGPGNVLLDLHAARHLREPFDRDGKLAAGGQVLSDLLKRLLAEPFLQAPPPKSTGRELFSARWLDAALQSRADAPADIQRTLTEFTARCIGDAIAQWCASAHDVVVCGGGAHNPILMGALESAVHPRSLMASTALGAEPEQVEALAFAWLAQSFLRRGAGNLPAVTGARGPRILGALYPH